jgi:hypothetical protein
MYVCMHICICMWVYVCMFYLHDEEVSNTDILLFTGCILMYTGVFLFLSPNLGDRHKDPHQTTQTRACI